MYKNKIVVYMLQFFLLLKTNKYIYIYIYIYVCIYIYIYMQQVRLPGVGWVDVIK